MPARVGCRVSLGSGFQDGNAARASCSPMRTRSRSPLGSSRPLSAPPEGLPCEFKLESDGFPGCVSLEDSDFWAGAFCPLLGRSLG